jgi:hypothetical protein
MGIYSRVAAIPRGRALQGFLTLLRRAHLANQDRISYQGAFAYEAAYVFDENGEALIRVRVTCKQCGDSTVASACDGTMQDWKDAHPAACTPMRARSAVHR